MKTTLTYSTFMTLSVHTLGLTATIDLGCKELSEVLEYVDCIFHNATMFHKECVDLVYVIDTKTGELIATCEPDGPIPVDDDPDWGYNEDMGYDPYMGCYTDDC